jgi:hypothetical protein
LRSWNNAARGFDRASESRATVPPCACANVDHPASTGRPSSKSAQKYADFCPAQNDGPASLVPASLGAPASWVALESLPNGLHATSAAPARSGRARRDAIFAA